MIVEIKPERAIEKVEKIAKFIVERKMAAPALMTIESLRPLNYIGSQLLYFLAPFAEIIFDETEYEEFAALLEHDEYIKLLLRRIEELDDEMYSHVREERKKLQRQRWNKMKKIFKKKIKNGGKYE
jgi:hypothetical protein